MQRIESRVAILSQERGFSNPSALARAAGLSRRPVQKLWEGSDRTWNVKFSTLTKLCHTLDATVSDLLVFIPDDAPPA